MKKVVITGLGAVSACGAGVEALWTAARDGASGVVDVEFPAMAHQSIKQAARISTEVWDTVKTGSKPRFQDRVSILAQVAAREAVAQAGLGEGDFGPRCGVVVGSGFGGAETLDVNYSRFFQPGTGRFDPMAVPKIMTSSAASWIAMDWKATGPLYCIATACSSATQSIGLALDLVRSGRVDRCLAGGAEALLIDGVFNSWETLHVMTSTKCRPFSRERNGMILGEGAGIVVVESAEAAARRGAKPIVELLGHASTSDANDLLRPDPNGAASCMRLALADAGLSTAEIGYVNAHGTGTIANDLSETEALREVFGEDFDRLSVSSTKPIHGHALGAAGALELIVTIEALRAQIAPPTIGFLGVDPKIGFEPVPNAARAISTRAAMSNSFAFGGINAAVVIGLPEGQS